MEKIRILTNKYAEGEEMEVELHEHRKESAEEQIQRLKEVRRERDSRKVAQTLKDLQMATREQKNVMPYLLECCRSYATVGEMTKIFKEIYGEFKEPSIL